MTDTEKKTRIARTSFSAEADPKPVNMDADYGNTGYDIVGTGIGYGGTTARIQGVSMGNGCFYCPKHEA